MNEQVSRFKHAGLRVEWEDLSLQVLERSQPLPARRVLCYFDDERLWFCPPSWCGVFVPNLEKPRNQELPSHVKEHIWDENGTVRDALIHIPGYTSCAGDKALFAMAFAHELRHFRQWAAEPEVYKHNKKVEKRCPTVSRLDLPFERDAIIFSKHVAVAIMGVDVVNGWARAQIKKGDSERAPYWEFFQSIQPSEGYDWIEKTACLADRHDVQASLMEPSR